MQEVHAQPVYGGVEGDPRGASISSKSGALMTIPPEEASLQDEEGAAEDSGVMRQASHTHRPDTTGKQVSHTPLLYMHIIPYR